MAIDTYIRDSSVFRLVRAPSIRDAGTWLDALEVYVMDGGTWRKSYSRLKWGTDDFVKFKSWFIPLSVTPGTYRLRLSPNGLVAIDPATGTFTTESNWQWSRLASDEIGANWQFRWATGGFDAGISITGTVTQDTWTDLNVIHRVNFDFSGTGPIQANETLEGNVNLSFRHKTKTTITSTGSFTFQVTNAS